MQLAGRAWTGLLQRDIETSKIEHTVPSQPVILVCLQRLDSSVQSALLARIAVLSRDFFLKVE